MQISTSPQWDDIRYFLEVARQGSLSAAARIMNVEHSTVARRVDALETALAVRLFDRLPRRWHLTPEGQELLTQALRLEAEAAAFSRTAHGLSSLTGTVRLSAPPVFTSHFLVERLAPLRQEWPGITLELVGETRDADLSRREADLALRLSRPTDPELATRPLGELGYGLYATPAYLTRAPESWEFLGYDHTLSHVPQQQWLQQYAGSRPLVLRSNDLATLMNATLTGFGVAALPHFLASDDPRLSRIVDGDCPTPRPIWLAVHPDVRRSPRVRIVADAIAAAITLEAALLRGGSS